MTIVSVEIDVDLDDIATDDLIAELNYRKPEAFPAGKLEDVRAELLGGRLASGIALLENIMRGMGLA